MAGRRGGARRPRRVRVHRVAGHEIGHLHGDRVAHFGFPRDVGAALREQGRVGPHPVNRHSTKLAARQIEGDDDVRDVIELMRLNYDRVVAAERDEFRAGAQSQQ